MHWVSYYVHTGQIMVVLFYSSNPMHKNTQSQKYVFIWIR